MSQNTIPFPGVVGNQMKNVKADKLAAYFAKEGLNFFRRQDAHDSYDTSVFMTALPAGSHKLICAIITNNSMYTLIRVHLGTAPKGPARKTFAAFLNKMNGEHAIVKYIIDSDDNVFLDVCITSTGEGFDPDVVRTTLNLLVYHLGQSYEDVARRLDKPGDQTDGFSL